MENVTLESRETSIEYWKKAIESYSKLLEAVERDPDQEISNIVFDIKLTGPAQKYKPMFVTCLEYCQSELNRLLSL